MSNAPSPSPPNKESNSDKESTDDSTNKKSPPSGDDSTNEKSPPSGDDSTNEKSPPPPESSENSPPSPPPPDKSSSTEEATPPKSSPPSPSPPDEEKSTPPPRPSKNKSPQSPSPAPPNKKSPPPPPSAPPPEEQSPPPPSAGDKSQSSSKKSPPPPVPSPPPSKTTTSPPPSPPSETLTSPPSSPLLSPPPPKGTTSSPENSAHSLTPGAVPRPPPHSSSNASGGPASSPSGDPNNNNDNQTQTARHEIIVNASVVVGGIVLFVFILLFFFIRRRKRKPSTLPGNQSPNIEVKSDVAYYKAQGQESTLVNSSDTPKGPNYIAAESGIIATSKTFFTYEELMEMTDGFSRENIIGEGGFGCVYKGRLPDGKLVAVKRLKVGSGQGEREFKAEVEIISRIHHRHLVSLVGYCIAENQRLLIYDFVKNKTLEHHLHGKEMPVLVWPNRVKIAGGAARGLAYLHEDCQPRIIHRDIKSANILLEDEFEAQVADFGLARLNDTSQTHVSTRVMGTFGYLAPEYASSGKLTDRSDVFSFGVVLLELITGRKPVDPTRPLGDESLVEWARPVLIKVLESGDISEIIDPRLEKRYVESEVLMMIEAAAACVRHSAVKRPRMAVVARALDFEAADLSNGVKVGQSIAYDSGKYSEEIAEFRRMAALDSFSSESEVYSDEFTSREVSHGRPSWKSEYSTSSESGNQTFGKSGSGRSFGGASGSYSSGSRFK